MMRHAMLRYLESPIPTKVSKKSEYYVNFEVHIALTLTLTFVEYQFLSFKCRFAAEVPAT